MVAATVALLSFVLSVQAQALLFNHFTVEDGLSHNGVMSIYQDYRGFIWLGTRNGISLYDGNGFTVHKYDKNNPGGLLSNRIKGIIGDGKENIFINTDVGINVYHIPTEKFSVVCNWPSNALCFDGSLYFASENKVYNFRDGKVRDVLTIPSASNITRMFRSRDSLFVGTEGDGLFLLQNGKEAEHPIPKGHVYDIFRDSFGDFWVTSYDGLGLFRIHDGKVENFRTSPAHGSISSDHTHVCCEDFNGDIWIGTFEGLNRYDRKTGKFSRYYKNDNEDGLTESSFWSLYCDVQGTVWAGTYYGGVNYFTPSSQAYRKYSVSKKEKTGLSSSIVGEFTEDGEGHLWNCTEGGGICEYIPETREFRWYRQQDGRNSISHNHSKALYYDRKSNMLWIGTHTGGLNSLDLNTKRFTCYRHDDSDPYSIPSDIVMDIEPYGNGLALATYGGVAYFDPETGKCSRDKFISGSVRFARTAKADKDGNLWIINAGNSLFRYSPVTRTLDRSVDVTQLSESIRFSLIYPDDDRLWMCTDGYGLYLWHLDENRIESFDTGSGLASNVVYAVRKLSSGSYIVTTDLGYSIFDYDSRTFSNYYAGKNMPLSTVNENSLYQTSDGEIFIGGMDGMVSFHEADVKPKTHDYSLYASALYVNGVKVSVGDESGILKTTLTETEKIVLGPECRTFGVEWTSTDYLPYNREKVLYRLEGFSEDWMEATDKMIVYSNLNPGNYTLRLKTDCDEFHELPLERSLEIRIRPPFYKTIWAYLSYVLIIGAIVVFLLNQYRKRIKLKMALVYEKKHVQETEMMAQSKFRFFADVSHELRTPITIIIGQLEQLLMSWKQGTQPYNTVSRIYRNSLQLKALVTELLDFHKMEQGFMKLKIKERNLVEFLNEHYRTFRSEAERKKIDYRFISNQEEILVWFDAEMLWKVMNNLVSNAFKHTPDKGEIRVVVYRDAEDAVIEVRDNGEGIAPENIGKIFGRFYQEGRTFHSAGTGIGLALTKGIVEQHHGSLDVKSRQGIETIFTIRLKTGKAHFSEEEISDASDDPLPELVSSNGSFLVPAETTQMTDNRQMQNQDRKILVVEDKQELRDMLASILAPFYDVICAGDGEEGLEKTRTKLPDLVLSDVLMPRMSGTELCRKIKEDSGLCHIPVLLLTSDMRPETVMEGINAGADYYLEKPFNTEMLVACCNNLINNRLLLKGKYAGVSQVGQKEFGNNPMDKKKADEIVRIVRENMGDDRFNVEVLVRQMGISRTRLFSIFRDILGTTPNDFIQDMRLKEAATLLKEAPFLNVTEISEKVGFNSAQYFRRCFKEKYKMSPVAFRNSSGPNDVESETEIG